MATLVNNQYPTGPTFKTGLYTPYSTKSYEPESRNANFLKAAPIANNSVIYNQYPNLSTTNLGTNISYVSYPTQVTTNFVEVNNQSNEYLLNNDNTLNLTQISSPILGENYTTSITYPNLTTTNYDLLPTNQVINSGIPVDNYSTSTITIAPTTTYSTINQTTVPVSYESIPSYENTININSYQTPNITNLNTFSTQPNNVYEINGIQSNIGQLSINTYPTTTITHNRSLSSYNSTPNVIENVYSVATISPEVNLIQTPVYTQTYRSSSLPRRIYTTKTFVQNPIVAQPSQVIIPNQNVVIQRPTFKANSLIPTVNNLTNTFVIPKQNVVNVPTLVTNTPKPLQVLPRSNLRMNVVNGYTTNTINTLNGNILSTQYPLGLRVNPVQFRPLRYGYNTL